MEKKILESHLKLHLVVLIYGFTAILGKLITLPAIHLVWYRILIALVSFYVFLKLKHIDLSLKKADQIKIMGVGLIVALHWITFFGAIKLSNVSVTLGSFATTTLFTSFIEPFYFRKKVNWIEVLIGLVIIGGLYLIFRFETKYTTGIIVALISAFLAGLFTVLNKKLVVHFSAPLISFYEMVGGFAGITIYLMVSGEIFLYGLQVPNFYDVVFLFLLGTVCTAYAFSIQVDVMKHLSAFMVTLTVNLEPVYGIIMAFFIFGGTEKMTGGFYIGTLIILFSVIGFPLLGYLAQKRKAIWESNRNG